MHWVYEALVWVGAQRLMPMAATPANATGLMFGKAFQQSLGAFAAVLGASIHFGFAMAWGAVFALIWPWFQRRGWEATLIALVYAVILWIVMHTANCIASHDHPDYTDPVVIIGGCMSHFFFTVPLALYAKRRLT